MIYNKNKSWKMILLSAETEAELEKESEDLCGFLINNPDVSIDDVAYTLQTDRKTFKYRRTMVCESVEGAVECLKNKDPKKVKTVCVNENKNSIVFMFPGQGGQYVNMGEELYRTEPIFRDAVDECGEILKPLVGYDVKDILYPADEDIEAAKEKINQTEITQPILFVFEYALAKMMIGWGVKPSAMVGYSFGEYVCAHIAGVMTLSDVLKLIVYRGELMKTLPKGAMLSVPLEEREALPLVNDFNIANNGKLKISIAIANGSSCIVAGSREAIEGFENYLKENRYFSMQIPISYAVHSPEMEPISKDIEDFVAKMELQKPKIPYISGLTGTWIADNEATDPKYWARHIKETIRFSDGISELLNDNGSIFVEVGPGMDLCVLISRYLENQPERIVNLIRPILRKSSDLYFLTLKLAHLWAYGIKIDWDGYYKGEKRKKIKLVAL